MDPAGQNVNKIVPHFPFATIFKNLVIRFNNKIVADYDTSYTWLASHMRLTKINQTLREVCDITGRYGGDDYEDTESFAYKPLKPITTVKRKRRAADEDATAESGAKSEETSEVKVGKFQEGEQIVEFKQEKWGGNLKDRFEFWSDGSRIYLSTYLFADLLVSSQPCIVG